MDSNKNVIKEMGGGLFFWYIAGKEDRNILSDFIESRQVSIISIAPAFDCSGYYLVVKKKLLPSVDGDHFLINMKG